MRKIRIKSAAYLFGLASVSLLSCGGSNSSIDSASSISSEEPSSSVSSEELFVSNVSAVFSLDDPFNPLYPEVSSGSNPVLFQGYQTYDELYEGVGSAVGESEFAEMVDALEKVSDYMSSSDDYAFVVWTVFGTGDAGFWYDFYDNTLTRHRARDCYETAEEQGKMEVVMVSRDMVDDFETVAFEMKDHTICQAF